jgi:hypothetical protein
MGRQVEEIGPALAPTAHQHLLLLLALELLVVEMGSAALVRWEIAGHDGKTRGRWRRSCPPAREPNKLKGRRASRDDPPNMVSGWMLQPGRRPEG